MATKHHGIVATRLPDTLHAWLEYRLREYRTKLGRLGITATVTRSDVIRSCIAEAMERDLGDSLAGQSRGRVHEPKPGESVRQAEPEDANAAEKFLRGLREKAGEDE